MAQAPPWPRAAAALAAEARTDSGSPASAASFSRSAICSPSSASTCCEKSV